VPSQTGSLFLRCIISEALLLGESEHLLGDRTQGRTTPSQSVSGKWDTRSFHMIIMLSGASVPPPSDLVLGVKDKILTIDLPHELRAKFNSLFELLFGLAL
jgi:hypothetical protein